MNVYMHIYIYIYMYIHNYIHRLRHLVRTHSPKEGGSSIFRSEIVVDRSCKAELRAPVDCGQMGSTLMGPLQK